jgi:hypothetical protein
MQDDSSKFIHFADNIQKNKRKLRRGAERLELTG